MKLFGAGDMNDLVPESIFSLKCFQMRIFGKEVVTVSTQHFGIPRKHGEMLVVEATSRTMDGATVLDRKLLIGTRRFPLTYTVDAQRAK